MPREIHIDRGLCMGSGQCVWYAPSTFDQDNDNIAIVVDADGDDTDAIGAAVTACPTQAINVAERTTTPIG